MLSTCPSPSVTSSSAVTPIAALATEPLADTLAPAAPPRARFRRLVVFDGRLA